jgi:hypothetical protein
MGVVQVNFCVHYLCFWLGLCVLRRTYRQDYETLLHVEILSKHYHHHHQVNYLMGMWGVALTMLEEKPPGVGGLGTIESSVRGVCVAVITKSSTFFGNASNGMYIYTYIYIYVYK